MNAPLALLFAAALSAASAAERWCAPSAIAPSPDGRTLYVACAAGERIDVVDAASARTLRNLRTPGPATGLALSADGRTLYAACAAPRSRVAVIDAATGRVRASIPAGHTAQSPALSADGKTLYVCNRLSDNVSVIDLARAAEVARIQVAREPEDAAPTRDGRYLLVANGMPTGRSDGASVAAEVAVVDLAARRTVRSLRLPSGSTGLRAIRLSPDGALAAVTHLVGRYQLPTTQVERGWMETNGVSLIDVARQRLLGTALLDEVDRGAANPWAAAWSADGKRLLVSHAGAHEVSVIDAPALLARLAKTGSAASIDMALLVGLRRRVALAGNGPRALAIAGARAWAAGYFSDTLEAIDLAAAEPAAAPAIQLPGHAMPVTRRGERLFNDAALCFQGWQSCASCHGPEARVDGLNWDLLNDGVGNPKNVKSLLLAHRTPPAMSQYVREDAEAAVRAGIRHILFSEPKEDEASAIDEWVKSLRPAPSPHLAHGKLSVAAQRGRKLFFDRSVGCASCHPSGLFTDLRPYDVGTRARTDTVNAFDTPTLVEIWRTAPYLHDGSAATLRDVLTKANHGDRHGRTSHLAPAQVDDLVAYLLTL
jgi:YVTN family beta-propeller protein